MSNTLSQASQAVSAYRLATSDAEVQQRRVARLTSNLRGGINFALSDLVGALQQSAQSDIEQVGAIYEFQEVLSKIHRLTLDGSYADIPGRS